VFIAGTVASLVAFGFTIQALGSTLAWWQWVIFAVGGGLFVLAIISEFVVYSHRKPFTFSGKNKDAKINKYLYKWINQGGMVAIFSRNMSWANDQEIKDMLHSKARAGDLTIYLPDMTELAEALKQSGARIYIYSELNHIPESRFTIINKGQIGARVAVGRAEGNKHVIEEFSDGQHPAFSMADDLAEIIKKFNDWKRSA